MRGRAQGGQPGAAPRRRDALLVLLGVALGLAAALAAVALNGGGTPAVPQASEQRAAAEHEENRHRQEAQAKSSSYAHEEEAIAEDGLPMPPRGARMQVRAEAAPSAVVSFKQVPTHARRASEIIAPPRGAARNSSENPSTERLSRRGCQLDSFDWCNFNGDRADGKSYCTAIRNQHLPQYCGSCWAHGQLSALSDRIKIARGARGADIQLSVQHLLNCAGKGSPFANLGSCFGGFTFGAYMWMKYSGGITYESAMPYMACSSNSASGVCKYADWSCTPMNTARTCDTFPNEGGSCWGLQSNMVPMATIKEYGRISGAESMMREIHERGPIACGIDANYLVSYMGGIVETRGERVDHVISVVGWGSYVNAAGEKQRYWWVRNSWGEFWGEMGFARVAFGSLHVEDECAYAVLDKYTDMDNQVYHCPETGGFCAQEKCDHGSVWCQQPSNNHGQ